MLPLRGSGGAVGVRVSTGRGGTKSEGSLTTAACPITTGPSRPIISLSLELRACDIHTRAHTPNVSCFGSVHYGISMSSFVYTFIF